MQKVYVVTGLQYWNKAHCPVRAFEDWYDQACSQSPKEATVIEISGEPSEGFYDLCTVNGMGGLVSPAGSTLNVKKFELDPARVARVQKLRDSLDDEMTEFSDPIWEHFDE